MNKQDFFYYLIFGKRINDLDLFFIYDLTALGKHIKLFFKFFSFSLLLSFLYEWYFSAGDLNVYLNSGYILILGNFLISLYPGFINEKKE